MVSEPKLSDDMKENEKLIVLRDTELIFVIKNVLFIIVVWLLLIQPMKENITTIRKQNGIKAKTLIFLCFIRVKWHFVPFIYTVVEKKNRKNFF